MAKLLVDSKDDITEKDFYPYVSSESGESSWGQPPASHYVFVVRGGHLVGRQVGAYVSSWAGFSPIDEGLLQEFASWEALSDEDLHQFEAQLD